MPLLRLLLFSVLAITSGIPLAGDARAERVQASLAIDFVGSSTLHDFEGAAPPVQVVLERQPEAAWSGEVAVPVATLDTGIDARDDNLRVMLDAPRHPQIRGRFRDVDAEQMRGSGVLPLLLRIRDVERPVQAKISGWQQDDERRARFDAAFDLSLAAFGLEPPRVLFMRVDDTVRVTVHVTLERL